MQQTEAGVSYTGLFRGRVQDPDLTMQGLHIASVDFLCQFLWLVRAQQALLLLPSLLNRILPKLSLGAKYRIFPKAPKIFKDPPTGPSPPFSFSSCCSDLPGVRSEGSALYAGGSLVLQDASDVLQGSNGWPCEGLLAES